MYCPIVIDPTPAAELIIVVKDGFLNSKDVLSIVEIRHPHFHSNGIAGGAIDGQ